MTVQPGPDRATWQDAALRVDGMTCRHCVRQVTAWLRDVPGVEIVEADAATGRVRLRGRFSLPDVLSALARAGHRAQLLGESVTETLGRPTAEEQQQ